MRIQTSPMQVGYIRVHDFRSSADQPALGVLLSADHTTLAPSPWIVRWSHLVAARGSVLDVACGKGRHMRWFHERNHAVTGVDRSEDAINSVARWGRAVRADIESGGWPLTGECFDAVVVTNYLWRPRLPDILRAVAPGGVLLYETFATGNETVGKPSRADFLLRPDELLTACAGFQVVAYENGFLDSPQRFVQRIAAVRPPEALPENPARHALEGGSASQ